MFSYITSNMHEIGSYLVAASIFLVTYMYFRNNPLKHSRKFMWRRFINWFPLGMTYAFLYMGRYNLNVSKNAMGDMMTKEQFGLIFGIGTVVYGLSFLLNGPLVDKIGGKKGIIIAALGSSLANVCLGVATFLFIKDELHVNMTVTFAVLYSINMFFQSYGAVSIIKVKAYWFHVRERGVFGAIFGTLISFGVYFAFDWGQAIVEATSLNPTKELGATQNFLRHLFAIDTGVTDATWFVFFIPAAILVFWALLDMWLLKDTPGQANFEDFDTHDATTAEDASRDFTMGELLERIFTNPIMLTIATVEFSSGVMRNGITQWYFIFAKEVPQPGGEFFLENWGLLLFITGVIGGFLGGLMSDNWFHSRRGPPAVILNCLMLLSTAVMAITLFNHPLAVGFSCLAIAMAVIGVHSLMSGTAAADFGGRKMTATASGIVDGCVYLGSGLQSISLGYLTPINWIYWPLFLMPFTVVGMLFAMRMWQALPEATKRYLVQVEKVSITVDKSSTKITKTRTLGIVDSKE